MTDEEGHLDYDPIYCSWDRFLQHLRTIYTPDEVNSMITGMNLIEREPAWPTAARNQPRASYTTYNTTGSHPQNSQQHNPQHHATGQP